MAGPLSYREIVERSLMPGRDFRIAFGDANIEKCFLVALHGGGIEPGTSEILRAVSEPGDWAWYEFAGFLRSGNREALHLPSTLFDEPTLLRLLPQAGFVIAIHGAGEAGEPVAYIGGKWTRGRQVLADAVNSASSKHGIRAVDATHLALPEEVRGLDDSNITNRGRHGEGVQIAFSREARHLLFPPDASREARGRRSAPLRRLANSIARALTELCRQ